MLRCSPSFTALKFFTLNSGFSQQAWCVWVWRFFDEVDIVVMFYRFESDLYQSLVKYNGPAGRLDRYSGRWASSWSLGFFSSYHLGPAHCGWRQERRGDQISVKPALNNVCYRVGRLCDSWKYAVGSPLVGRHECTCTYISWRYAVRSRNHQEVWRESIRVDREGEGGGARNLFTRSQISKA